ncbi:MAG: tyrosine-type recombinase/integrase [Clostridia bacterium]|nr:tyrosine-type recombinase/integrase [Clostridia bacterium]
MNTLTEFEAHLLADGKSLKTISSYMSDVRAFYKYLNEIGINDAKKITRAHITGFRGQLLKQDYKPATINKALNSLNAYTNFLIEKHTLPSQAPLVKSRQDRIKVAADCEHSVDVFSEEELSRILSYINTPNTLSLRDRLLFYYLLYTGCRVSELCTTKLSDLDLLTGQVKVSGKGGKIREIPLRPDLVEMIQLYIKEERAQSKLADSPFLFTSQRAGQLNRDTVNKVLDKVGAATGLHIYPHKLRHQFCTKLISAGVPVVTVSRLAGHADPSTTAQFYVNTSRQDKENAVNLL